MSVQKYCLGFCFDDSGREVVLIKKNKPEWQAGLLNGIGGKVEANERPSMAMIREFREECGVDIKWEHSWEYFCQMRGPGFSVFCYKMFNSAAASAAKTMESEEVGRFYSLEVFKLKCVSNLPWLVHLALDNNDGRKHSALIQYKE